MRSARGATARRGLRRHDDNRALEVLFITRNEPPSLFKRSRKPPGNWLLLKLVGVKSNRHAIGARVRLFAGGLVRTDEVRRGGSYLSQSDLRLHFGFGEPDHITIRER